MDNKKIEKHGYKGKECKIISFDIADKKFHCVKIKSEPEVWEIKSYAELSIPSIVVEMPKRNMSLEKVSDMMLMSLAKYLESRQEFEQELLLDIYDLVREGKSNG